MIQIARVDYPRLPTEFDYLKVERTGGIAGVHETLSVEPRDELLGARVHPHVQQPREFLLDASQAEHVLASVQQLAARIPGTPGVPRGADMFAYVVEIGWAGKVIRFVVQGVPGDDALHGVLEFASALWS